MSTKPLYHVFRDTVDYHNDPNGGIQDSELRGSYWTYDEAKAAAKKDLIDDWGRSFFDEYEEEEEGEMTGLFQIDAVCPEGETMTVYIQKKETKVPPSENTAQSQTQKNNSSTVSSHSNNLPTEVNIYHVFRHRINYHMDPSGNTEANLLRSTWWTYDQARLAVEKDLIEEYGPKDTFTEYEEEEEGDTGFYEINATTEDECEYHVYIEEGKISAPPPNHPFGHPSSSANDDQQQPQKQNKRSSAKASPKEASGSSKPASKKAKRK